MMRIGTLFLMILFCGAIICPADQTSEKTCSSQYVATGECPADLCELQCLSADKKMTVEECKAAGNKLFYCTPKPCERFSLQACPKAYCEVMTNCSKEQVCVSKIPDDQIPSCGGLAYNGQKVECCSGMIKRCGFDYLDGTCNMEGKNTPYHFAICIPCGDGVCSNFENHCNCPEDCKKILIPLKK